MVRRWTNIYDIQLPNKTQLLLTPTTVNSLEMFSMKQLCMIYMEIFANTGTRATSGLFVHWLDRALMSIIGHACGNPTVSSQNGCREKGLFGV